MSLARVLLCHNQYRQRGGEALVFENLVRGLRERGHDVTTYVRDSQEIDSMTAADKARLFLGAYSSRRTERDLSRLVSDTKPDVAIVQNVFPLMSPSTYTTLQARGVPIVQATYNYRFVCPAAELYSRGEICERCIGGHHTQCVVRRCYRNSAVQSAWYASIIGRHRRLGTFANAIDVFQVPDSFMAGKLAQGGLPRSKMVTNVNPFFVGDHVPANDHDGYIAYAGRLTKQKGVLTLLEAATVSRGLRVVIAGQGELEPALHAFVRARGLGDRVRLAGPLWGAELHQLLSRACAVAIPSEWYDNLPLVLCQANALGTPVLASRINGIPEYVEDGVNGYLFEPGNAAELRTAAERVTSLDPSAYAHLAATSRRYAEAHFDFDEHYRVLSGIFARLSGPAA